MHAPKIPRPSAVSAVSSPERQQASFLKDDRPETAAQLKLKALSENNPVPVQRMAVNDDPALEQEADRMGEKAVSGPVVQRAKNVAKAKKNRYYHEEKIQKPKTKKKSSKRKLKPIDKKTYDGLDEDVDPITHEEGYEAFSVTKAEKPDWDLNGEVVELVGKEIRKKGSFMLPVSCIESAQHVVHYANTGTGTIPDWDKSQSSVKSVNLHLGKTKNNYVALDLEKDYIDENTLKPYKSFHFNKDEIRKNEGLLVVNKDNPGETIHAVVVVGKNDVTGQLIVLERNAGTTSGGTDYLDDSWVLNIYDSPDDFLQSMPGNGSDYIIGKLVAF